MEQRKTFEPLKQIVGTTLKNVVHLICIVLLRRRIFMAVVFLTVSRTASGVEVDDALAGGEVGVDFGTVPNNGSSQTQELYIRHDGSNEITDLSVYVQPYIGIYGGAFDAASDFSKILALGDDSSGEYGLHYDEDWNAETQFSSFFKFKTGVGDNFSTKRSIQTSSMFYRNPSTSEQFDVNAGVAGTLGPDNSSTKASDYGNRALIRERLVLPASETEGGIRQWSTIFSYVYTS